MQDQWEQEQHGLSSTPSDPDWLSNTTYKLQSQYRVWYERNSVRNTDYAPKPRYFTQLSCLWRTTSLTFSCHSWWVSSPLSTGFLKTVDDIIVSNGKTKYTASEHQCAKNRISVQIKHTFSSPDKRCIHSKWSSILRRKDLYAFKYQEFAPKLFLQNNKKWLNISECEWSFWFQLDYSQSLGVKT